ncbi:hypothetical protein D3C84_1062660 [compost metagenome]
MNNRHLNRVGDQEHRRYGQADDEHKADRPDDVRHLEQLLDGSLPVFHIHDRLRAVRIVDRFDLLRDVRDRLRLEHLDRERIRQRIVRLVEPFQQIIAVFP